MSSNPESIISFAASNRHALLSRLCADLKGALGDGDGWQSEAVVLPWHATAPSFELLPERVIAVILQELEDAAAALLEIECSGFLETDLGPRAWGCLVIDEARPSTLRAEVDWIEVSTVEPGYRLEARIRLVSERGSPTDV